MIIWSLKKLRRLIVAVIGITILGIGIAMVFLPGPAMVVIPVALGILATEFAWARCLLHRVRGQVETYRNSNHRTSEITLRTPKELAMGLDDLFKRRGHHNDHGYYGNRHDHHGHHGSLEQYLHLFERLKNNRKLLKALVVLAVVIVILVIAAGVMLIPLIMKLLGSVQKGGIKGLIETARPLLELLWNGSGK